MRVRDIHHRTVIALYSLLITLVLSHLSIDCLVQSLFVHNSFTLCSIDYRVHPVPILIVWLWMGADTYVCHLSTLGLPTITVLYL